MRLLAAVAILIAFAAPHQAAGAMRVARLSRVTWYRDTGWMANGNWTHDGAAACPRAYMGATVHVIGPDLYFTCEDTGAAWYFETGAFRLDVWATSRPWWMDDWMEIEVD